MLANKTYKFELDSNKEQNAALCKLTIKLAKTKPSLVVQLAKVPSNSKLYPKFLGNKICKDQKPAEISEVDGICEAGTKQLSYFCRKA